MTSKKEPSQVGVVFVDPFQRLFPSRPMVKSNLRVVMRELRSVGDLRKALDHHESIVIHDKTGGAVLHPNPWSCRHVLEDHFIEKVITYGGRNGGYFAVSGFDEAAGRWPSLKQCE